MRVHSPLVIHYVNDMDRAHAFYHDTLGLTPDMKSDGWSTLKCGDFLLGLHILPAGKAGTAPHAGLNLQVDDLDEAVAAVAAGGGTVVQVREAGGGAPVRIAELTDPEGNHFELRQYVG